MSMQPIWRRYDIIVVALLIALGIARIVATYPVFSQTTDEPAHIGAGMQWLDQGKYTYEAKHPPLARVAAALGPYLDGVRSMGRDNMWDQGNAILHARSTYFRNLALARLGILPFFILATVVVWLWTRWLHGSLAAVFAVALFTTLPPILAHSGLATTDMALTATLAMALFAFARWLEQPSVGRGLFLGLAASLTVLSKLSALLFLPAAGVAMVVLHVLGRGRSEELALPGVRLRMVSLGLGLLVGFIVIWSAYRFSVAPLSQEDWFRTGVGAITGIPGWLHGLLYSIAEAVMIPAPELARGIEEVAAHNRHGHLSYFLGEVRNDGWWLFFPVAIAVKTPLPFLLLTIAGLALLCREMLRARAPQRLAPGIAALALLVVSLPSHINIGLRHVLPIYPLLAVVAGFGAASLWTVEYHHRTTARILVVALLAWQLAASAAAHPDYLAYFNELAGSKPENILIDSDLDWGQDLQRLSDTLRRRGLSEVSLCYNGAADLTKHGLPKLHRLSPYAPTTGWVAISLLCLKEGGWRPPYDGYAWLEAYQPVELVGRSIRLYHIPAPTR